MGTPCGLDARSSCSASARSKAIYDCRLSATPFWSANLHFEHSRPGADLDRAKSAPEPLGHGSVHHPRFAKSVRSLRAASKSSRVAAQDVRQRQLYSRFRIGCGKRGRCLRLFCLLDPDYDPLRNDPRFQNSPPRSRRKRPTNNATRREVPRAACQSACLFFFHATNGVSDFQHDPSEQLNPKVDELARAKGRSLIFAVSPEMASPSLDQYLQPSPKERALQNSLYWEQLMNPQRLAFLAALLKMALRTKQRSRLHRRSITSVGRSQ